MLYFFGGILELSVQEEVSTECWYSDLTGGICKDRFDYSDHSILHFTHFLLPAALELSYLFHTKRLNISSLYSIPIVTGAVPQRLKKNSFSTETSQH